MDYNTHDSTINHNKTAMTAKKLLLLPLVSIISVLVFTSCDDDDYDDYLGNITYNLTSRTWANEQSGYDEFGREYYTAQYVDFYGDGTGEWETYTEIAGYRPQQTGGYFTWDFTNRSYSVLVLEFDNNSLEYWMIDDITPDYFSSFVSPDDPYYFPNTPNYFQEFWAVRN